MAEWKLKCDDNDCFVYYCEEENHAQSIVVSKATDEVSFLRNDTNPYNGNVKCSEMKVDRETLKFISTIVSDMPKVSC